MSSTSPGSSAAELKEHEATETTASKGNTIFNMVFSEPELTGANLCKMLKLVNARR
jgi:hypothetical protein